MNCASIRTLMVATAALTAVNCVHAVETYGEPPWRKGIRYEVKSTYEMSLENIVLDVNVKKPESYWERIKGWEWTDKHAVSDPFSGKYTCRLNYRTGHVERRGQGGSALRNFDESDLQFRPTGSGSVIFTLDPTWWRNFWGQGREKVEVPDMTASAGAAEFYFSQIFDPDKAKIHYANGYFVGWKQRDATSHRKNLDVWRGPRLEDDTSISHDTRMEIWIGHPQWTKCTDGDMAYNVIQAESKLMTYAIYGQTETRRLGEAWLVDAEILTAFLPQLAKEDQPFEFTGGSIVLKVTKMDEEGDQIIEMLPSGKVNGKNESSDLRIQSSYGNKFNSSFDSPDLADSVENYVRFKVDEDCRICRSGKVNIVLHRYQGDVPRMGQLELHGKTIAGNRLNSRIAGGTVKIHAEISTEAFDVN